MGLDGTVRLDDLPDAVRLDEVQQIAEEGESPSALSEAERVAIERALKASDGNKSRAAAMLKISRTRLYRKIREYGLTEHLD